jgi:hypothetical protein
MGNTESRQNYFKEHNIDPYSILGIDSSASKQDIKKAYKRKAKDVHPDRKGGNDIQFKILAECYSFCIDTVDTLVTKTPEELRNNSRKESKEKVNYERSFQGTNWDDQNTRQQLFANADQYDFDNFKDTIKTKERYPTNYGEVEKKSYTNIFGNDGNYNHEKFNSAFEMQNKNKIEDQDVDEIQGIDSFSSMCPLGIETYNGLIVEKRYIENPVSFRDLNVYEPELISNMNTKKLTQIANKTKKDTKTISKKKMSGMVDNYSSARSNIKVDTSKSYAENESFLYEQKMNNMRAEMDSNKKNVMRNLSIYPQNVIQQFHIGQLEDSSSVIFGNSFGVPKGIRRK